MAREPMKDRDITPAPVQTSMPVAIPAGQSPMVPGQVPGANSPAPIMMPMTGKNPYDK